MPPPKTVHVNIHLPGHAKFGGYKSALNEYCQKKHIPTPKYTEITLVSGFRCSVEFDGIVVQTPLEYRTVKMARNVAAFEALKRLEYLSEDAEFDKNAEQCQNDRKLKATLDKKGNDIVKVTNKITEERISIDETKGNCKCPAV